MAYRDRSEYFQAMEAAQTQTMAQKTIQDFYELRQATQLYALITSVGSQ